MPFPRWRQWFNRDPAGGNDPRRRRRLAPRPRGTGLTLERLEERVLLSAAITGTVFNDLGGSGVRQPGDPGVAGQVVYLDLNQDGNLNSTTTQVGASSLVISGSGPGAFGTLLAGQGGFGAPLQVQGLPPTFQDVAVNLDLTNNSPDPIPVTLASPLGEQIPNVSLLFTLMPGQHFVGTFDGSSTNPVTRAAGFPNNAVPDGTYAPQQAFTNPQYGIDNSGTNGTWGLVFFGPPADVAALSLKSWSLTFTTAEPSTQTDAGGHYSFTGLAAGPYRVGLAHSAADTVTHQPANPVTVTDGQTLGGVDFGLRPGPDLTASSFRLVAPATAWGQQVTVNYVLANRGAGNAPAFDVGLYLSGDGVIRTSGPLLGTVHVAGGLPAGTSAAGSAPVTLPALPPPGFGALSSSYLGLVIDPAGSVPETQANQSNQGPGIDLALLGPKVNTPVAAGPGTQQDPSLAVDPGNPQHLVTAFMDSSLLSDGYAGIGVAVSDDGGQTWAGSSVPLPAGFDQGAASPTVAFDGGGNVYVSFMSATFLGPQPSLTNPDAGQRADGFQSNNGIFVAKSTDGGHTWGTPVAVVENTYSGTNVPFAAFPDLAIDTIPGSPYGGRLYVTWSQYDPAGQFPNDPGSRSGSDVMIAVSTDGGASWATQYQDLSPSFYDNPVTGGAGAGLVSALKEPNQGNNDGGTPGQGLEQFSTVSVGAGGAVYVASYAAGLFAVYASTDGGLSTGTPGHLVSGFTAPDFNDQLGYPFLSAGNRVLTDPALTSYPDPDLNAPAPVTDNVRTLPLRQVVADPTRPGVVYALAASALDQAQALGGQGLDAAGIVLAVSTDFGQTWTSNSTVGSQTEAALLATVPVGALGSWVPVLNDDNGGRFGGFVPSGQGQVDAGQALPALIVNGQGDVAVIWYDTRSDPNGKRLEVWGTVSTDGGRHFGANFPVTAASFDPNAGPNDYLGDQIGLASTGGTAYAVWTDTRNGDQDVFFSSFALAAPPALPARAAPALFVLSNTLDLGTTAYGTAGTAATFTVSGADLTAPVVIAAPAGVQLSADGSNWLPSLTLTPGNGTLASTAVDVRLQAGDNAGVVSGSITLSSSGAVTQDVAVGGTVKPAPVSYAVGDDTQSYGRPADLAADLPDTFSTGVKGETLAITYGSPGDTATAAAGRYAITGTLSDGTGRLANYRVTLHDGTLTVLDPLPPPRPGLVVSPSAVVEGTARVLTVQGTGFSRRSVVWLLLRRGGRTRVLRLATTFLGPGVLRARVPSSAPFGEGKGLPGRDPVASVSVFTPGVGETAAVPLAVLEAVLPGRTGTPEQVAVVELLERRERREVTLDDFVPRALDGAFVDLIFRRFHLRGAE